MTPDEALATVQIWHDSNLPNCCDDSPACALAAEVQRLRPVERRAQNLVTINEPMTSRTARIILGEKP